MSAVDLLQHQIQPIRGNEETNSDVPVTGASSCVDAERQQRQEEIEQLKQQKAPLETTTPALQLPKRTARRPSIRMLLLLPSLQR